VKGGDLARTESALKPFQAKTAILGVTVKPSGKWSPIIAAVVPACSRARPLSGAYFTNLHSCQKLTNKTQRISDKYLSPQKY
jgi:hypothetical protein